MNTEGLQSGWLLEAMKSDAQRRAMFAKMGRTLSSASEMIQSKMAPRKLSFTSDPRTDRDSVLRKTLAKALRDARTNLRVKGKKVWYDGSSYGKAGGIRVSINKQGTRANIFSVKRK